MPGLFGMVAVNGPSSIERSVAEATLSSMRDRLDHQNQQFDFWQDPSAGIYVGRVGPENFNTVPWRGQFRSGGRTAVSAVAGSFVKSPRADREGECAIGGGFLRCGTEILRELQGVFVVLVSAKNPDETIIAIDRCAHLPLYYAEVGGVLYFAPEVKGLMCVPGLSRDLDYGSVATMLSSGHVLSGRSLLSAVQRIRGGQALSIQRGRVEARSYWEFAPGSNVDGTPAEKLEEELGELITQAVRKNLDDPSNTVIFLSGGADSRAIVGGALDAVNYDGGKLNSVTWAADRKSVNSDAGVAESLAQKFGLNHRFVERRTGEYERDFQYSNHLIDGQSDLAAMHPYEHQLMRDLRDEGFTRAFRGDQVFGQGGMRKIPATTNEQALADCTLRRLRNLARAREYIRPEVFGRLADACDEVLDSALTEVSHLMPKQARDTLYFLHRTQAFLNSSSYLKQIVFDPRNILLDDDILEFLERVPDEQRQYKGILQRAMARRHPELWSVRFATENNLEDWDWQFGHDTMVRRYAREQFADTSSAIWDFFDPAALSAIVDSLEGYTLRPNPVTKRPVKKLIKKSILAVAPKLTARIVIGREARFHPKNRILVRVLTLKHWYDSQVSGR